MRFASKSQNFNREVRKPVFGLIQGPAGPEQVATRENILAQFRQSGLTEYEKQQCLERLTFNGHYEGEDPLRRVSIYDTDTEAAINEWDAETKAAVEQNLLEGEGEWYFRLEEYKQPKPWPKYDDLRSADKIAETVGALGLEPEAVIAYERENKNRDAVIAVLSALTEDPEPLIAA